MNFSDWFSARHPQIPIASANAVLKLAEGGATVPFIARYRKEETGKLDEVGIRAVIDDKESWDEIVKRQAFIIGLKQRGTASVFTAVTMTISVGTWIFSALKFQADMGILLNFPQHESDRPLVAVADEIEGVLVGVPVSQYQE